MKLNDHFMTGHIKTETPSKTVLNMNDEISDFFFILVKS